jgi:hypothetical protein
MTKLNLKRASASRPSGEWRDDDYDVLAEGVVVGRIMKATAVPAGMSWMWTLAFGYGSACAIAPAARRTGSSSRPRKRQR